MRCEEGCGAVRGKATGSRWKPTAGRWKKTAGQWRQEMLAYDGFLLQQVSRFFVTVVSEPSVSRNERLKKKTENCAMVHYALEDNMDHPLCAARVTREQ